MHAAVSKTWHKGVADKSLIVALAHQGKPAGFHRLGLAQSQKLAMAKAEAN